MSEDSRNFVPTLLAILLHGVIAAVMLFGVELTRPQRPAMPLAIQATLVSDSEIDTRRVIEEPEPEAEPEPEPQPPEPEPEPEPPQEDAAEQARIRAEAEARQQAEEQAREQERIRQEQVEKERQEQAAEQRREEEAEQRRLEEQAEERRKREEAERERQRQEALEQQKREEAEKERLREEAERKRLEDIERQRRENERRRQEAEEAERQRRLQQELAEEEERMSAMSSGEMAAYIYAIQQKIQRNWIRPASAMPGLECVLLVRQVPGGEVVGASIERCNGDAAVQRSIEAAVFKASPLPEPDNPSLFDRNLRIIFKPEQ